MTQATACRVHSLAAATEANGAAAMPAVARAVAPPTCFRKSALCTPPPPADIFEVRANMVNALAAGTHRRIAASKDRYAMIVQEEEGREWPRE